MESSSESLIQIDMANSRTKSRLIRCTIEDIMVTSLILFIHCYLYFIIFSSLNGPKKNQPKQISKSYSQTHLMKHSSKVKLMSHKVGSTS